jgi:tetratricopeptide (TPR) repeat protein
MKYRILMLILFASGCAGVTQQEYFLRANKAYKMGKYQEALDNYMIIKDKGCAVWCNMGLCYQAQNQEQQALYCWYKALQQAPSLKIAYQINNLLVEQEVKNKNILVHKGAKQWMHYVRPLVYGMPLGIMQWAFILLLMMLLIGSWYYHLRWVVVMMILISILSLLIGTLLSMRYYCMTSEYAIIAADAPLYIGPDTSYYKSGQTGCPALVRIVHTDNKWTYITHASRRNWVENTFLKSLNS